MHVDACYPSLGSIHHLIKAAGKESGEFQWSLTTTTTVIKSMGFKFVKSHVINHAILIENPFIIQKRKDFITRIRQYRAEGKTIYFFDESYINR